MTYHDVAMTRQKAGYPSEAVFTPGTPLDNRITLENTEELVKMMRQVRRTVDQSIEQLDTEYNYLVALRDELPVGNPRARISTTIDVLSYVISDLSRLARRK